MHRISKKHRQSLAQVIIVLSLIAGATRSAEAQTQVYSSSSDYKTIWAGEDIDGDSLASNAAPGGSPQYGQSAGNGYPTYESRWSRVAFEGGGGFTAPIGNDQPFVTYGYNLTLGAGWNFNKKLEALLEYQFNRNKIPGATLSAVGAPGGNVNTWSLTVDPIYQYATFGRWGGYVTGGGGFYRKVTNYTSPQPVQYCDYFYGYCGYEYQNTTIGHFSSNQGGLNIGAGITWRIFGPDSRARLYAEARYVWVDSPRGSATRQGTGTEELIPVTIGIRF
jgi:Outer membrane protein beta-barrel domain